MCCSLAGSSGPRGSPAPPRSSTCRSHLLAMSEHNMFIWNVRGLNLMSFVNSLRASEPLSSVWLRRNSLYLRPMWPLT